MDITTSKYRLTCFWTDMLAPSIEAMADDAPMAFLRQRSSYENVYDQLRNGGAATLPRLSLPWRKTSRQRYWTYYAEQTKAQQLTPQQVWKFLIPMRVTGVFDTVSAQPGLRIAQEGFVFPFGTGYVVSLYVEGSMTLEQVVDRAVELRHGRVYTTAAGGAPFDLQTLAENGLLRLREAVLGSQAAAAANAQSPAAQLDPWTLVSITQAKGADLLATLDGQPELQRALAGLARLSRSWRIDALKPLADLLVAQSGTQPLEHRMLGTDRGRCIWQPHDLEGNTLGPMKTNCYHRNLMYASLQVQSLLGLIHHAARASAAGNATTGPIDDCVRYAAGLLGRIYGGDNATYRTASARRHIDDSGSRAVVDQVRKARAMGPLS